MKQAMVNLLQQWADKCTTEQFWAVAALTGMNAFVIAQKKDLLDASPAWGIIAVVAILTIYGTWYVVHRHISYQFFRVELAKLLHDETEVPTFLKESPPLWKGFGALSGVVFYVLWIVSLGILSVIAVLR